MNRHNIKKNKEKIGDKYIIFKNSMTNGDNFILIYLKNKWIGGFS